MSQWFRGQLEGHYVGTAAGGPYVSEFGSAARYKMRIYRALIRNIEILERGSESPAPVAVGEGEGEEPVATPENPPPEGPPEDLPEDCFYQAKIEDTRLIGIRPRSCFEGTVYDLAVSDMQVTHATKKGEKTYGRVTGVVYGRFLLPPEAEPEEAAELLEELSAHESAAGDGPENVLSRSEAPALESAPRAKRDEDEGVEPLHAPEAPASGTPRVPSSAPIPLLVVLMAIVLALGAGTRAALFWLGLLVPLAAVRLMLSGMFDVTPGQRIFGAFLVLIHFACLAVLGVELWTTGSISANLWAFVGLAVTAQISSILPSPAALLITGAGLGLTLLVWYGGFGIATDSSDASAKPAVQETSERPTVDNPGVPRTNKDGSWPRRPPRSPKPSAE